MLIMFCSVGQIRTERVMCESDHANSMTNEGGPYSRAADLFFFGCRGKNENFRKLCVVLHLEPLSIWVFCLFVF